MVNSLDRMVRILRAWGDSVTVVGPDRFRTLPCPTYPEIPLALASPRDDRAADRGRARRPSSTSRPRGRSAFWRGRYALSRRRGFTTSYHTKFPEYLSARVPVPLSWGYAFMRRFHNAGSGCMVATASLRDDLARRGFKNLVFWSRGVDHRLFRPRPEADLGLPRPIFLSVGRVAVEKNLEAFLKLDLPGSKVVVGDGPARARARRAPIPQAHFLGALPIEALADAYAAADVFVFPSLTDTFGNVLLEALASGLAGRGLPGDRAARRGHGPARRRPRRRSAQGGARRAQAFPRRRRANSRWLSAGKRAPGRFATTSSPPTAQSARGCLTRCLQRAGSAIAGMLRSRLPP